MSHRLNGGPSQDLPKLRCLNRARAGLVKLCYGVPRKPYCLHTRYLATNHCKVVCNKKKYIHIATIFILPYYRNKQSNRHYEDVYITPTCRVQT
ncbi:hypothetical protein Hanom_Chr13g01221411 [Helianthus anomalus]